MNRDTVNNMGIKGISFLNLLFIDLKIISECRRLRLDVRSVNDIE